MIASLDGAITLVATDHIVLEVNGVGYRVYAGPSTLAGGMVDAFWLNPVVKFGNDQLKETFLPGLPPAISTSHSA